MEKIIETTNPVYTFQEVVGHIDLNKYFAGKDCKTGHPRYDREKLLKVVLFAFLEHGYPSLRRIEKLCKTDIRFLWLLDEVPAAKPFFYLKSAHIRGKQYGRTEEFYQCADCEGCSHRNNCHKSNKNPIIRLNTELTVIHKEVLRNLNGIHGACLRMNRSIQAEGEFGEIKANRGYERLRRRGKKHALLEISLISCGFNLHKYDLSRTSSAKAA